MRILLAISLCLGLTACGFRLQGGGEMPPIMARTHVVAPDDAFVFGQDLGRSLRDRGVELVAAGGEGVAELRIHHLRREERVLSVSELGTPLETEIAIDVAFTLTAPDGSVGTRQALTLTRDHTWDPTDVLARETESAMLVRAMEQELVRRILSRLSGRSHG